MLQKLKEYKELIAIIVFFLGGVYWLNNNFPSKSDLKESKSDLKEEIQALNCVLEKYMTLTQLQIRGQELDKQINELAKQLAEMPPDDNGGTRITLSPAMKLEWEEKNANLRALRDDLRTNANDMKKVGAELARQICGKVSP